MNKDFYQFGSPRTMNISLYRQTPGDKDWYQETACQMDDGPIADRFPLMTVFIEDRYRWPLPDVFDAGMLGDVVSERFRKLCDGFNTQLEFLPVKIERQPGIAPPTEPFWLIHPLDHVDCIDYEESEFERVGSGEDFGICMIDKLVLRPEAIGDRAIFRPAHTGRIFCSRAFRDAVEKAKLKVAFYPLPPRPGFSLKSGED